MLGAWLLNAVARDAHCAARAGFGGLQRPSDWKAPPPPCSLAPCCPGGMLAASPGSAQGRLEEIALAIRDLDRRIKSARKRKRRHADVSAVVRPFRKRMAVTLSYLSGSGAQAASWYLAGPRERRTEAGRQAAEDVWRGRVEEWYLEGSVDDVVALGCPGTHWQRRALHAARRFKVEHALHVWVVDKNKDRGVAPTTSSLRMEALSEWRRHQDLVDEEEPAPHAWQFAPAFAVWACRWRRRWGGRVGALRLREHVPVHLRRLKVLAVIRSPHTHTHRRAWPFRRACEHLEHVDHCCGSQRVGGIDPCRGICRVSEKPVSVGEALDGCFRLSSPLVSHSEHPRESAGGKYFLEFSEARNYIGIWRPRAVRPRRPASGPC